MNKRPRCIELLVMTAALSLVLPTANAYTIPVQDFSDTSVWTPVYDLLSPAALDIDQHGFTVSVPSAQANLWTAGYKTAFNLHGDFTVDTDFLLEYWPQVNHVRIGINFLIPPMGTAIERTSEGWGVDECYIFDGVGQGLVVTADMAGSLRLTRNGSILSGYYLNQHKEWALVGSGPVTTADAAIGLLVWPDFGGGGPVKVTFANPSISTTGYLPSGPPFSVPETSNFLMSAAILLPFILQRFCRAKV